MALRLGDDFPNGPAYRPDNLVHSMTVHRRSQWTARQKVVIDRRYLFAEQDAVEGHAPGSGRKGNAGRPGSSARKHRDHDQVVANRVPYILGDDKRRPRLVRIIWLAGCENVPDLAATWLARTSRGSPTQVRLSLRRAASRRTLCQASSSIGSVSPSSANWSSIAERCCAAAQSCNASSTTLLRSVSLCASTNASTSRIRSGSSERLTFTLVILPMVSR
jgi:hypothetical protein